MTNNLTNHSTSFRVDDLRCHLGFDCSALPPSAHSLEQSLEFERASRTEFAALFDLWKQDRSFAVPFTAPDAPVTVPILDVDGDFDLATIEALAREHLSAHLRGPGTLDVQASGTSSCYYDPLSRTWVIIHGFHVEIDGQLLTADPFVDAFAHEYRNRPQVPASFDADSALLRQLPVVFFVSWPR